MGQRGAPGLAGFAKQIDQLRDPLGRSRWFGHGPRISLREGCGHFEVIVKAYEASERRIHELEGEDHPAVAVISGARNLQEATH